MLSVRLRVARFAGWYGVSLADVCEEYLAHLGEALEEDWKILVKFGVVPYLLVTF